MFAPILCVLRNRSLNPVCGTRHLILELGTIRAVMPDAK